MSEYLEFYSEILHSNADYCPVEELNNALYKIQYKYASVSSSEDFRTLHRSTE